MAGYHVHEKAIMTPLLLLTLLTAADPTPANARVWLRATAVGHLSLLPLLPGGILAVGKIAIVAIHWLLCANAAERAVGAPVLGRWDAVVAGGVLFPVVLFAEVLHPLFLGEWEGGRFLPLMVQSVVYAGLNLWIWAEVHLLFWREEERGDDLNERIEQIETRLGKLKVK